MLEMNRVSWEDDQAVRVDMTWRLDGDSMPREVRLSTNPVTQTAVVAGLAADFVGWEAYPGRPIPELYEDHITIAVIEHQNRRMYIAQDAGEEAIELHLLLEAAVGVIVGMQAYRGLGR